jgi:DNA-binding SARP family transcriptional activator
LAGVQVSVLGPVTVTDGSGEVTLGAAKERFLLAVLALNPGSRVRKR